MAESDSSDGSYVEDVYIKTDKLYVGTVLDLLNGDYHTLNVPANTKFYPQANGKGFVLHNSRINTDEEIGRKIVELKGNYDRIFHPRQENCVGVRAWYHSKFPVPYSLCNYIRKLQEGGVSFSASEGVEKMRKILEAFFDFVEANRSPEDTGRTSPGLEIIGSGGWRSDIAGLSGRVTPFIDTFVTSLMMTTDLGIFDDMNKFSVQDTESIVYILDRQSKLAGVICKVVVDEYDIGYCLGDQANWMLSKDNDVLFVDFNWYYANATGRNFNYEQ